MPAGNVPPNPSELLITQQMLNLLDELEKEFDLVIIDGTPSKLVTDAVILSRIVDSTIIVAGHNMAKKDEIAKVVRDIKNVGGNIAGVVYNKKPASGKKSTETYYYASNSARWEARMKQEIESERRRQAQYSRTNEMLNKDRKQEEYLKNIVQEAENEKKQTTNDQQTPEQRTTEMLNQFNEYLQKEKENRDKRNF